MNVVALLFVILFAWWLSTLIIDCDRPCLLFDCAIGVTGAGAIAATEQHLGLVCNPSCN